MNHFKTDIQQLSTSFQLLNMTNPLQGRLLFEIAPSVIDKRSQLKKKKIESNQNKFNHKGILIVKQSQINFHKLLAVVGMD